MDNARSRCLAFHRTMQSLERVSEWLSRLFSMPVRTCRCSKDRTYHCPALGAIDSSRLRSNSVQSRAPECSSHGRVLGIAPQELLNEVDIAGAPVKWDASRPQRPR